MISFRSWLEANSLDEFMGSTGAIYDGSKGTFNWVGAPGSSGVSIEGWPIGTKEDRAEKKKKKRGKKSR